MILLHNDNIMHIHRIIYTNLTHQTIGQLLQITYFSECYLKKNIGFSILLGTCEKNVKKNVPIKRIVISDPKHHEDSILAFDQFCNPHGLPL